MARQNLKNTHLLFAVNNKNGQRIFSSDRSLEHYLIRINEPNLVLITIPKEVLTPGNYSFFVAIHIPNTVGYDVKDHICHISVFDNGSDFLQYENKWFYGDVFMKCDWEFKTVS